jgi:hypothetical protein
MGDALQHLSRRRARDARGNGLVFANQGNLAELGLHSQITSLKHEEIVAPRVRRQKISLKHLTADQERWENNKPI